jgi:hypothetical protein
MCPNLWHPHVRVSGEEAPDVEVLDAVHAVEVFRAEDAEVLHTPVQAPNANAHAERWVTRSVHSAWTGCCDPRPRPPRAGAAGSTSSTTTGIARTERSGWSRQTQPDQESSSRTIQPRCTGVIYSAGCSTSTSELHDRICVPYGVAADSPARPPQHHQHLMKNGGKYDVRTGSAAAGRGEA